jgi:hypothetical protein
LRQSDKEPRRVGDQPCKGTCRYSSAPHCAERLRGEVLTILSFSAPAAMLGGRFTFCLPNDPMGACQPWQHDSVSSVSAQAFTAACRAAYLIGHRHSGGMFARGLSALPLRPPRCCGTEAVCAPVATLQSAESKACTIPSVRKEKAVMRGWLVLGPHLVGDDGTRRLVTQLKAELEGTAELLANCCEPCSGTPSSTATQACASAGGPRPTVRVHEVTLARVAL